MEEISCKEKAGCYLTVRDNGNSGESLLRRWLCIAAGDSSIYSPQHTRFILFFPDAETANTTSTLFPQMLQR